MIIAEGYKFDILPRWLAAPLDGQYQPHKCRALHAVHWLSQHRWQEHYRVAEKPLFLLSPSATLASLAITTPD